MNLGVHRGTAKLGPMCGIMWLVTAQTVDPELLQSTGDAIAIAGPMMRACGSTRRPGSASHRRLGQLTPSGH